MVRSAVTRPTHAALSTAPALRARLFSSSVPLREHPSSSSSLSFSPPRSSDPLHSTALIHSSRMWIRPYLSDSTTIYSLFGEKHRGYLFCSDFRPSHRLFLVRGVSFTQAGSTWKAPLFRHRSTRGWGGPAVVTTPRPALPAAVLRRTAGVFSSGPVLPHATVAAMRSPTHLGDQRHRACDTQKSAAQLAAHRSPGETGAERAYVRKEVQVRLWPLRRG